MCVFLIISSFTQSYCNIKELLCGFFFSISGIIIGLLSGSYCYNYNRRTLRPEFKVCHGTYQGKGKAFQQNVLSIATAVEALDTKIIEDKFTNF